MADQAYSFEQVRARLDEIVVAVRKKDISLDASLELLEESVRLVNRCNDLVDQVGVAAVPEDEADAEAQDAGAETQGEAAGGGSIEAAGDPEPEPGQSGENVEAAEGERPAGDAAQDQPSTQE
jgi:exodeoxyribonuclease VII small subunit